MILLVFVRAATALLAKFLSHPRFFQVSVSVPTWHSIYFLRTSNGGLDYRFGVFGYTGTKARLGYHFPITYVFRLSRVIGRPD